MIKLYTENDANPAAVKDAPVAVIGYGSQGRAHAMNLAASGCQVIVGVREGGAGAKKAAEDGLETASIASAVKQAKLIAILTPDMTHEEVFKADIEPNLSDGDAVLVAHGFTVLYGRVEPPKNVDVILGRAKRAGRSRAPRI